MDIKTVRDLSNLERPSVIDLWAPWCAPCRSIRPALTRLAEAYDGRVDLIELNVDEHPSLAFDLGVRSVPTLLAIAGGREVTRAAGALPAHRLAALFESALMGRASGPTGLALGERGLRLAIVGGFVALGLFSGPSLLLIAIGGVVGFLALRDRCPIWQAIAPQVTRAFSQLRPARQPADKR